MKIFCPKCGKRMCFSEMNEIFCLHGDMIFSKNLEKEIKKRCKFDSYQEYISDTTGAKWYCPCCSKPLNDNLYCDSCNISIQDLMHQLVELHPHKNWPKGKKGQENYSSDSSFKLVKQHVQNAKRSLNRAESAIQDPSYYVRYAGY